MHQDALNTAEHIALQLGFGERGNEEYSSLEVAQNAFAVGATRGFAGALSRELLDGLRRLEIVFTGPNRQPLLHVVHPRRSLSARAELYDSARRPLGAIQQRFSLFRKRFDLLGATGQRLLTLRSGFVRGLTFTFFRGSEAVAVIELMLTSTLAEAFHDKERFRIRLRSPLTSEERLLVLAAATVLDPRYFAARA